MGPLEKEAVMHPLMMDEFAKHRIADFHRQAKLVALRKAARDARHGRAR